MASFPNANALNNPDIASGILQHFQAGQQQRQDMESRNALATYAQNPDDPNAISTLIRADPRLGLQARNQQQKLAADERDEITKLVGGIAKGANSLEEWDAGVDMLVTMGFKDAEQYRGKFSPAAKQAMMAAAGVKPDDPDLVVIDGVAMDKRTGQPVFESPYDRIIPGQGGSFYRVPRMGLGRGGAPAQQPQGVVVPGEEVAGWEDIPVEGGAGQPDPQTFP